MVSGAQRKPKSVEHVQETDIPARNMIAKKRMVGASPWVPRVSNQTPDHSKPQNEQVSPYEIDDLGICIGNNRETEESELKGFDFITDNDEEGQSTGHPHDDPFAELFSDAVQTNVPEIGLHSPNQSQTVPFLSEESAFSFI